MAYINRNYNILPELRLSTRDYYDIQVSNYPIICGCDFDWHPITCITFNDTYENCGDENWVDAVSEIIAIKDFGITAFDNRFLPTLESDYALDGGLDFCVTAVSGDTYCYEIFSGSPVTLNGGFFQGFYKLEGYEYQVLPDFYKKGWTIEMVVEQQSGSTCVSGKPLLNDDYPDNKGIFYYIGTRAENKFCSLKEHLLKYEVQSGLTFLESVIKDTSHITPPEGENAFTYFNNPNLIRDYCPPPTGTTFVLPNCCDGLKYNALAFRIKDGKIGYRYMGSSGSCINGMFEEYNHVYEEYSSTEVITENQKHLVTITFKSYDYFDCKPKEQTYGVLSIYVDGFLKFRKYDFPNIIPYAFNDTPSKQLGVPYNISIGGGTQGLLEMQTGTPTEYNVCDYQFYLKKDQHFKGIIVNGVQTMSPEVYTFEDEEEIVAFLESTILGKLGDINVKTTKNYIEFTIKFVYDSVDKILYSVEFDNLNEGNCCDITVPPYSQFTPNKTNCFSFITDNTICGDLEENFAGTFIGKIYSFCLYDKPLNYNEINCNKTHLYT